MPAARPRLLANFGLLSIAELVSKLLTFAALGYLTRVLGAGGFGDIEFAGAVLMCAGLVVELGFGPYGARELARNPSAQATLVGEIVGVRLLLAVLAYATIAIVALFFAPSPSVGRLLLIYGLSLLGMPLMLQWVFQGHDVMHVVALAAVARQGAFAAVVFLFVRTKSDAWLAGTAEIAAVFTTAVLCTLFYLRRFSVWPPIALRLSTRLVREGGAIGLSQLFWAARMYGGVVLLRYAAGSEEVGYYASASRILLAAHTFVWLYYFNLLPTLTRAWHDGRDDFVAVIRLSQRRVVFAAVACGLIWVLAAPYATTLMFGVGFAPASAPLQWLAGVCVVAAINGHYRYGLIAAGRQTTEMMIQAAGAIVTVVAIPLGQRWSGPAGAAAGLLASELVVWAAAWFACRTLLYERVAPAAATLAHGRSA